ncbi:MAG: hypothetical protein FWC36_03945 [Spirochaetes bacterium]|nr:hypothetical protein [Spirochaetota bacterium]
MTLIQRNNILLVIIGMLLTILTFLLIAPYLLYIAGEIESSSQAYKKLLTPNYIFGLLLIFYSAITLIFLRFFFYKTNSIEIIFFMLFLTSLIFEASRPMIIILNEFNFSFTYVMFLSRVAYFSKICGVFALFAAALASSDIGISRSKTSMLIIAVLSLMFASAIPLSSDMFSNGYNKPGFFNYYLFTLIFIKFLTVLIFVINYFQKRNKEYLFLALGIMLIITGKEITFYMTSFEFFLAGMVLLVAGTVLFSKKIHEIYKWD